MAPSTMKALKIVEKEKAAVQEVSVPQVKADRILVKVSHVALNPTDWKHIDHMPSPGATVGCDYAGTIEALGPDVEGNWKVGDRIAGVTHGSNTLNHEDGAFGEYALVKEGGAFKVPDSMSDADAATLGVGIITTGLALYQKLALPWPGSVSANVPVLIYGGSSATGTIAIQYAKLSGATVLTTCSPRNFELVKKLGASEAFDYNDPECVQKIRAYTGDKLHYVMDCVGGEQGVKISSGALSSKGGQLVSILPGTEYPREDVRKKMVLGYTANGERVKIRNYDIPGMVEEADLAKQLYRHASQLLAEGKIQPHPARVGTGLESILEGLDEMRQGKVSGVKLVYKI